MTAKAAPCLALLLCAAVAAEPVQPEATEPMPAQPARMQSKLVQPGAVAPAATPLLAKLTDKVIRDAVRETLAELPQNPQRYEGDVMRGIRYAGFHRQAREARLPDCLHPDGLQRQPTFIFNGLLAMPFIAIAKLRGKCN
jgi:hypothetical protein